MENKNLITIKSVADQTGLSTFLIRAWENRYNAVNPERTESNRRLYSEKDVIRLNLLHSATQKGYSIKNIADLPNEELQKLVNSKESKDSGNFLQDSGQVSDFRKNSISEAVNAIKEFNAAKLEKILMNAGVELAQPVLLQQLIIPLMIELGELWRKGEIRIAHEHLASEVVRNFLLNIIRGFRIDDNAPKLIVATPQGQQHEIGSLVAAVTAASEGWKVLYLGSDLPYREIAYAVRSNNVKAVLLGIIYPTDDLHLHNELTDLSSTIGDDINILVAGRGAEYYKTTLNKIGASIIDTPDDLIKVLKKSRN